MPGPMDFVSHLAQTMKATGFDHYGWVALEQPTTMEFYRQWLQQGLHGTMDYLETHAPLKENTRSWAPRAESAIVVTRNYFPHPYPDTDSPTDLRTALYARGQDYHFAFKAELESAAERLRELFPEHEFLCFTDSAPILERDLAQRAGLGWTGKNTCLIDPKKGSLFWIGQILTSVPATGERPRTITDHCGTCDRCLQACPTQALIAPRVMDARRCISYLTIEDRSLQPVEHWPKMQDWFFGCDICQTVCPWNEKIFGKQAMATQTRPAEVEETRMVEELRAILSSSNKALHRRFAASPLSRARPLGLKRNALVLIGNQRLKELRSLVESFLEHPELKSVAEWSLAQL